MALMTDIKGWLNGADAVEIAEAVRRRVEEAGPPPVVTGLAPRRRAAFDRALDALNRLPRPIAVLGTLALFGAALAAPAWFEGRMEALSRMPEELWWLVGAVLSLHFGARYQAKAQEFQREVVDAVVAAPAAPEASESAVTVGVAATGGDAELTLGTLSTGPNAALADWKATQA